MYIYEVCEGYFSAILYNESVIGI